MSNNIFPIICIETMDTVTGGRTAIAKTPAKRTAKRGKGSLTSEEFFEEMMGNPGETDDSPVGRRAR